MYVCTNLTSVVGIIHFRMTLCNAYTVCKYAVDVENFCRRTQIPLKKTIHNTIIGLWWRNEKFGVKKSVIVVSAYSVQCHQATFLLLCCWRWRHSCRIIASCRVTLRSAHGCNYNWAVWNFLAAITHFRFLDFIKYIILWLNFLIL